MPTNSDVLIVGYPRSGNTWLSRLIADALNSPLIGLPERQAIPIGLEGLDRPGGYTVRQLHLTPVYTESSQAIPDPYQFFVKCWNGERIVLIMRDVRDVAVSSMFYWGIESLYETVRRMGVIEWPIAATDKWDVYNDAWLNCPLSVSVVRYEQLIAEPLAVVSALLGELGLFPLNDLPEVIDRQSFASRRKGFEAIEGRPYHPYGTGIQLANLRKGIVGDWHNHFHRREGELLHGFYFEAMQKYGYEQNPEWWQELPE